jgi:hypothetical protein
METVPVDSNGRRRRYRFLWQPAPQHRADDVLEHLDLPVV